MHSFKNRITLEDVETPSSQCWDMGLAKGCTIAQWFQMGGGRNFKSELWSRILPLHSPFGDKIPTKPSLQFFHVPSWIGPQGCANEVPQMGQASKDRN